MEYHEYNLDELGYLGRGKSTHRPRNDPALYGGEYPFVQTGDVKAANFYVRSFEQSYNEFGLSQSKLWDEGTLAITIAANIAETAVLDIKACFPDSVVGFIPNDKLVDVYFVKYYIDFIKREMQSISQGTTQDNLSLDKLRTFKFKVPKDRNVVTKISTTLLNYDNLIENNNRRIAILEEMAQSLYREWFVNFRYPNHKDNVDAAGKPKLIESRLGKIPEGWHVKTAADVIAINPQTKLPKEGEKPFVGMSGLSETSMVISDIIEKSGNSGAKFINNDTLFARITPCLQNGKTGFVQFLTPEKPVGFGSTEFIVLRESDYLSSEFIYLLSRSNDFREHAIQSMTGATGRQRVHNDCFASYYLAVPPKVLMNDFTKLVKPMFKSIFNLSQRNENLKKQRDMLLPKLISGTIKL
ncbi:type I restriction endonuclease subunit S [Vibrio paracholerae]|nr:type I restriction endonuclease subunit S [Vibrio paracholerae]